MAEGKRISPGSGPEVRADEPFGTVEGGVPKPEGMDIPLVPRVDRPLLSPVSARLRIAATTFLDLDDQTAQFAPGDCPDRLAGQWLKAAKQVFEIARAEGKLVRANPYVEMIRATAIAVRDE